MAPQLSIPVLGTVQTQNKKLACTPQGLQSKPGDARWTEIDGGVPGNKVHAGQHDGQR